MTVAVAAAAAAPSRAGDARFDSLVALSADAYWEQDAALRFTLITGGNLAAAGFDTADWLGGELWAGPASTACEGGWDRQRALQQGGQAFQGLIFTRPNGRGERRHIRCSGQPIHDADGALVGYRGIASDITDTKRAEDLLRLEHLVNRSLAQSNSAAGALEAAIRAVCETERWECGRYFFWDPEAGLLRLGACWGVADAAIQGYVERSREITYAPGVGLVGAVWQSGEPLWTADISQEPRAARKARAADAAIRGAFVFPLVADGKPIGALVFNSREVRAPEPRLIQAIGAIGGQIGQLVQRMQSQDVLRDSEERFRAVVDSANEGILVYDRALKVVAGNAVAERIIGLPMVELIGAGGFTSLLPCVHESGAPLQPA
ncbi:MAG: GAF domain-containing protein, partial [Rubrivivax sp.]|nr:GAF domain-containing protein [Rubrivivax sp.]